MIAFLLGFIFLSNHGIPLPQNDYVSVEIAQGITLNLPKSFVPMPEAVMDRRYLSARKPLAAYISPDQQADLSVNTSNARWQAGDLPMLQNFYRANILSLYDEVTFIKESLEKINGKDFAVFEFLSIVRPEEDALTPQQPVKKYTYIQYTIYDGKTYVFNFNSPADRRDQWEETAKTIMESIKLK